MLELKAALDRLTLNSDTVDPIIHLPAYFSHTTGDIESALAGLVLAPLKHDGTVVREEITLRPGNAISRLSGLEAVSEAVSHHAGFGPEPEIERFVFRYGPGQAVPEHQDHWRHAIVVMGYWGRFSGGAYVYRSLTGREEEVPLSRGDLLLCFNSVSDGRVFRPIHRVAPIDSGIRWVVAHSHVIRRI